MCTSSVSGDHVTIIRPLSDVSFDSIPPKGTTVELECELSQPNCKVQWSKGGKPVEIGRKYDFSPEGCVYRLNINDVTLDDMDSYQMTFKKLTTEAEVSAKSKLTQPCL